jgi:hypothetical protein
LAGFLAGFFFEGRRFIQAFCELFVKLVKEIALLQARAMPFNAPASPSLALLHTPPKSMPPRTVKLSVTVKYRLDRKYNAASLKKINQQIKRWIKADARRGIRTVHVAVDDSVAMRALRVPPVSGKASANKIKRAIDDLWKRLAPDYLVLFGGADIVPMFEVVNPSRAPKGDDDEKVPTDNPYACSLPFRSSNRRSYLVPDRVVGRIPDMVSDSDPAWFVAYLKTATSWTSKPASYYNKKFAICCDTWKRAGLDCIQYLARSGRPASRLFISPPTSDIWNSARKQLSARLHMIKCHGSKLHAKFYGEQRKHFSEAMASATLKPRLKPATVAAAMCCYGAQIFSPTDPAARQRGEWPLASTYLRKGALGFVGSTRIAWVGESAISYADWLVTVYLKSILGGASIGRAFLEAKQDYLRWVNQQGYALDLMDEKTLIEYVLLGDPSIQPVKSVAHPEKALSLQERRQRRVARVHMAAQIRELLPVRSPATPASARAKKVFNKATSSSAKGFTKGPKEFRTKPGAARVEKVHTVLPVPSAARKRPGFIRSRQSLQYYWSERHVRDGHKRIRLLKVETDQEGNLWRTSVIHSS